MTRLEIVEPRPEWPTEFRRAAGTLREAFGTLALRIDHIGSTSVPGLPAKDVIDIQIAVAALEPRRPIIHALDWAGLTISGPIASDHRPEGNHGPDEEWVKIFARRPELLGSDGQRGEPQLNVHVRRIGGANQRYPLLFRDYLRADPSASATYALIKRRLTVIAPGDEDAYYDIKDPVCDLIMSAAERWATVTGWDPGPSDA